MFNQNGFPTTDIRALGQTEQETTTYTYFADNLINTTTDQLSRVTTYNFDVNANPSSVTKLSGTSSAVTTSVVRFIPMRSRIGDIRSSAERSSGIRSCRFYHPAELEPVCVCTE